MASSETRQKILAYLHQLPEGQSVQPRDLANAVGLTVNQVNPSLTAARNRGEIEALANGSVRLSAGTRRRFHDTSASHSFLPDSLSVPLNILTRAIQQVPAVKYALGVAGIAAAAALAYLVLENLQNPAVWTVAGMAVLVVVLFMVILFIFAKLIQAGGTAVKRASRALMWFVLLLFMVICTMLTSSVFFIWPRNIRDYFTPSPSNPNGTPGEKVTKNETVDTERPPNIETITLSPESGFIKAPEMSNVFLQKTRKPGAPLKLRIGLANQSKSVFYIKSVSFSVVNYNAFKDHEIPIELATKIIATFEKPPSKEDIIAIESQHTVRLYNQLEEVVVFQVDLGRAASAISALKALPGIVSVNPSLTGEGQSPVDFVPASGSVIIVPNRKLVLTDIDVKLPGNDVAGLEVILQFPKPGLYRLKPHVGYRNDQLDADPIAVFVSD